MMLCYTITWQISKISRSCILNLHYSLELDKNRQWGFIGTCSSEPSEIVQTFLGINPTFSAYCFSQFQLLDSSFRATFYILKTGKNSDIIVCKIMQNQQLKRGYNGIQVIFYQCKIYRRQVWYCVWPLTLNIISAPKTSESWVAKAVVNLIVKLR